MLSIYLVLGAFAGMMSGLFGIGGGVVVIPALSALFLYHSSIPHTAIMHMAVGTSLAILVVTSLSSMYAHHKRQAVRWKLAIAMLPGLAAGSIVGAILAHFLPSDGLRIIFSIFLMIMGLRLILQARQAETASPPPSKRHMTIMSSVIGILSSVLGVGGGTLMVPYLLRCNLEMREATGTSVACGFGVGIVATICFMLTGLMTPTHIPESTGYIYWPAFFGIAASSLFFAPVGAMLAHKLPVVMLKRLFGAFLLVMAIDMLFFG